MNFFTNVLFGFFILLALSGCANQSGSSQRYSLPSGTAPSVTQTMADTQQVLAISSIELAEFLDSERIVLQLDDITLHQAREHLWADNLAQQIRRGLRSRLSAQLPDILVVNDNRGLQQAGWRLQLTIEQFQGHFDGNALTSGQWRLYQPDGSLAKIEPFTLKTQLSADGYPALVRALGNNLDQLALQLTAAISQQTGN